MKLRFAPLLIGAVALAGAGIPHALAQTVPLHGTIVSASTSVAASSSATVFTTPAHGSFVLTQFCGSGTTLSGVTFGFIAPAGCYSFSPGYALPASEVLKCTAGGSAGACSISGILSAPSGGGD